MTEKKGQITKVVVLDNPQEGVLIFQGNEEDLAPTESPEPIHFSVKYIEGVDEPNAKFAVDTWRELKDIPDFHDRHGELVLGGLHNGHQYQIESFEVIAPIAPQSESRAGAYQYSESSLMSWEFTEAGYRQLGAPSQELITTTPQVLINPNLGPLGAKLRHVKVIALSAHKLTPTQLLDSLKLPAKK